MRAFSDLKVGDIILCMGDNVVLLKDIEILRVLKIEDYYVSESRCIRIFFMRKDKSESSVCLSEDESCKYKCYTCKHLYISDPNYYISKQYDLFLININISSRLAVYFEIKDLEKLLEKEENPTL